MKTLWISLITSAALLAPIAAHAADNANRTAHYEATKPATASQAKATIKNNIATIEKLLAQPAISDADFETIHKISYTLEAAAGLLKKQATPGSGALAEAVEILHLASEDHDTGKTKDGFAKVKQAAGTL